MAKPIVVLGFSGGIDSTTAAEMLLRSGYDVRAIMLDTIADRGSIVRAQERANALGVEFSSVDVTADFQHHIIDYFAESYLAGRTPAPCTVCNPLIKWHHLIAEADRLGSEAVATGHYFNIVRHNDRYYVARADDRRKDQSYYLWGLPQSTLKRALTPMGHVIKEQIKQNFSDKRESMGLCFLAGKSYRTFMAEHYPESLRTGEIIDREGNVVGHHEGVAFYTIGQKRGFDSSIEGVSIVGIDAASNRLVVGGGDELYHSTLEISHCNIVDEQEFIESHDISVIIRGIGRNPDGYMLRAEAINEGYRIHLGSPAWAPAAGQPVVFYRGDRVIGGGIIERYY